MIPCASLGLCSRDSARNGTRRRLTSWQAFARTRLGGGGVRAFGRRRNQRFDQLVAETDDLVDTHIAADHPVRQPRLKRLIDDASVGCKIGLAAGHELDKRHFFGHATPAGMQNANHARAAGRPRNQFDLLNPLAAIAPVLLEDPRA